MTEISFYTTPPSPLIPGSVNLWSATIEHLKVGDEIYSNEIHSKLFTDGISTWTDGKITDLTRISGLLYPIGQSDAANKAYVDAAIGGNPGGDNETVQFNNGGVFGGDTSFSWNQTDNILTVTGTISGLVDPIDDSDAANKKYVDESSGNPGGDNNNIQFNNLGSFDGSDNLTWNGTVLNIVGTLNAANVTGTNISGSTVAGTTITDGTTIISGGVISGASSITGTTISDGSGATMNGSTVTAETFTDNYVSLSYGSFTDVTNISFMDDDSTPTTIDMGLNAGSTNGLGVLSGLKTLTGLSSNFDAANKAYVDAAIGSNPGLPSKSIQYNSSPAGIFTGDSLFTWDDGPSKTMTVIGTITDGTASLLSGSLSGVTTIDASGVVTLTNSSASSLPTNGALVVTGGVGIGGDINISGQAFADEFNAVSDIRLKENIIPLENSLDKLADIGCYSYNMIGSERRAFGVLAQQLEEIGLMDIVKETPDHKTVNYLQFIALLIDGVNELREEINDLKKFKIDILKNTLQETYHPLNVVTSDFKAITKNSKKNIKTSERKNFEGKTYKYCFECFEWTVLENFLKDSSEIDCYKKKCKRH
jgi:hypothetical protein